MEITDTSEKLPPPDREATGHPGTDLTRLSDDQLLNELQHASDTNNDALWVAAEAEWGRRHPEPGYDSSDTAGPPPPEGRTLPPSPDDEPLGGPTPQDADELADYLDDALPGDDVTFDGQQAVTRWQGMDRFYQRVQALEGGEGGVDDDEAAEVRDVLDDLIDRAEPLTRPVVVWRGERNAPAAFGIPASDLRTLVGETLRTRGFYGTSASLPVVRDQFIVPGRDPVIVQVLVSAGTRALWVPPVGDPALADQRELLMAAASLYIVSVVPDENGVPVVTVEPRS